MTAPAGTGTVKDRSLLQSVQLRRVKAAVVPLPQELLDLVNNELSPFVEKFTMSDLDIMSVNSDGSVSSSTGHVEDSKAAQPQNHHSSSGSQTGTGDSGTTTDPGTATDPGNTGDNSGTTGSDEMPEWLRP